MLGQHFRLAAIAAALLLNGSAFAQAQPATEAPAAPMASGRHAPDALFATVNGKPILQQEFHVAFSNYLRQTYYHGQVPADKVQEARKEVADQIINRILLLEEAKRRGLKPDEEAVAKTIAGYETRYGGSPMWQKDRERLLPGLKTQLEEQTLLDQIEKAARTVPEPDETAVRAFYDTRKDLFTEPEKLRLHSILLKVEPSSPAAVWEAAREEAARLVKKIRAKEADFEDLARVHSHDESGERGGDMGYLHKGMIPGPLQEKIDDQAIGAVTDPVDILEGVALFRLDERVPARLMPYDVVAARARELLKREEASKAWQTTLADLRSKADIRIEERPTLPPVTAPASTPTAPQ